MSIHIPKFDRDEQATPAGFAPFKAFFLIPLRLAEEVKLAASAAAAAKKAYDLAKVDGPAADPHDAEDWEHADHSDGLAAARKKYVFPVTPYPTSECVQIFDPDAVLHRYTKVNSLSGDRDEREKVRERLDDLRRNGEYRRLAKIPESWRTALDILQEGHPNFANVIDYLRGVCAIAERCDGVPQFANLLIDGPPGCGKTYFSKRLADCFGTEFHALHLETMQTSGEIVGDSETYRNSKPGALYNALLEGSVANPLVLMDEICKIGGDERFRPQTALYRIFERETAKEFVDCSEPWLKLDVSHFFFVCTSNNLDAIDPAIRSRLKRFTVGMPEDATQIIRNIFSQLKREKSFAFADITVDESAISVLMAQSPRRIRQLLEDAIGRALYRDRLHVMGEDIDVEQVKTPMGF